MSRNYRGGFLGKNGEVRRAWRAVVVISMLVAGGVAQPLTAWAAASGRPNVLNGVSCPAPGTCTAVGYFYDGRQDRALVEGQASGQWSVVTAADEGTGTNVLQAVSCTSDGTCVAVGYYKVGGVQRALVEELAAGSAAWVVMPALDQGSGGNALSSVSCAAPGSCTAVGYYAKGTSKAPLVEYLSSGKWQVATVPRPGSGAAVLTSVSCVTPAWCAGVGYYSKSGTDKIFAETGLPRNWTDMTPPDTGSHNNLLQGVSCWALASCWAVGYYSNGAHNQALAERLVPSSSSGSSVAKGTWHLGHPAEPGGTSTPSVLHGISCPAAGACTAVGASGSAGKYQALAENYTGTQWALSSGAVAGTGANVLLTASCPVVTWCAASGYWSQAGQDMGLNETMSGTMWAVSQPVTVLTPTTVTVKVGLMRASIGQPAVLTAVISPAPDTGTVSFTQGGAPLPGCRAVAVQAGAGIATCPAVFWTGGPHMVSAQFSGSDLYSPAESQPVPENVRFPATGYWLVTRSGQVFGNGGAATLGSPSINSSTGPVVGIAATPTGKGYWTVTAKGKVSAFGDAVRKGDLSTLGARASDIVAIAPTYDGHGYWLVGRDGGLFAFGDADYHGSVPALGKKVNDIVGMVSSPTGSGYVLVGSDGGIFAFGSGEFHGSLPAEKQKVHDIRAILPAEGGDGYLLVGADGGVFIFGNGVPFHGSLPGEGIIVHNIVGIALKPGGGGYFMAASNGNVFGFGSASPFPTPAGLSPALPVVAIAGT